MSRCFPFPPPGYEKKFKAENLDLLIKEKHREKKHKKEKKDKEKKERKEKKEKDRDKDKHKEKKERKEKHRDKKKSRDIEKGRTPEDNRVENRTEVPNELHVQESSQKAEGGNNDSKFTEELGRRTRDDGAANQLVGNTTSSINRQFEGVGGVSSLQGKEKGTDKKMFFPAHVGSAQRNSGIGMPFENIANSLQRRAENFTSTSTSIEKERSKMHGKVIVDIGTESNKNHGISRPDSTWLANRKAECSTAGIEKERSGWRNTLPNSIQSPLHREQLREKVMASTSVSTQKRNNVMCLSVENLPFHGKPEVMVNSSIPSRMEGVCAVPSIEKERTKGRGLFPHPFSSEQRTKPSIGQPVEMDRYPMFDGKDTNQNKKNEDRKGLKDGDHSEKKSKPKNINRHNIYEKEKEEKIVTYENIEIDKTRNFWKKDHVDALNSKPLAPHKDNTTGIIKDVDITMKKRKDLKTNGFLHENDARPSKMPRLASSSQPPVNDRTPDLHLDAPLSLSLKDGAMNNLKPDSILDNNVRKKINGTSNSQQLAFEVRPPPAAKSLLENGDASSKLPHPDSAYLQQIYTVPKMEAWPEIDDLDWLFDRRNSQQKPKIKHEAETAPPQVWAEALQIDSANVCALPYVVPF